MSSAQRGRAHRLGQSCVLWQPVLGRGRESLRGNPDSQSQEPCQRVVAVVRAGHQPIWMFEGNEFADRLAAKGPKRTSTLSGLSRKSQESGVWPGPCRVGLPLSPWTWPSITRTSPSGLSYVAVPRKHQELEECIGLFVHVLVAGRRVGSVKCAKCLQVCGKKHLRFWLPTACMPWQAKNAPFIPCRQVYLTLIRHLFVVQRI